MAFECVVVKQEPPDLAEEAETPIASTPSQQNVSDFVNNKIVIEVPATNIRIKTEPPDSPDSPLSRRNSWDVPVTNETKPLPGHLIHVSVKKESLSESEDPSFDNPLTEDQPSDDSDDSPLLQATTSKKVVKSEHSFHSPKGKEYICQICKKSFVNSANLQRHLLIHTRETVKCDLCDLKFVSKQRLEKHIFNRHTPPSERVYPCDVCPKTFKTSSNLMQHKKTHLTEKPHKCPLCFKTFSFKTNLKKHQGKSRCKISTGEPLMCNICHKVFQREFLLKSHIRKHDTAKPFSCELCSTAFKYKSTLIRHMQLHNGIRPYSCPECDKTFTSAGLLKPHMRVHTGEKPFTCELCPKTFAHKHNMQRHMQRHEKVKHLVCDICHKEFPRESRLKYHMKTHVNEKYFRCHVCPKRFSHKQNVLRHYTRKHPGQTYNCTDTDASVALKVWDSIKSKYCDDEAEVILG